VNKSKESVISGKVFIVTGAAKGIGAATVAVLEERGANVLAVDRDESISAQAAPFTADVASREANQAMVNEAVARWGKLDGIVLNAGVVRTGPTEASTEEDIDLMLSVNFKGAIFGAQAALPHLRKSRGSIVIMSSKTAVVAQEGLAVYAATKGGVLSLMRALSIDNARFGVRSNAILPGVIDTPMLRGFAELADDPAAAIAWNEQVQPLGRLGEPREAATAIAFLLSEDASFVTGVAIPVDGGYLAGQLD
jgi:NAD(P)-dependent dehydrogenase (short-subunit alcohol dehydrogenase family)